MNDPNDPIEAWIGRGPPAGALDACPDENRLAGYAEGRLPAPARPALEAHLARCEVCRGLVAALADGVAAAAGSEEVGGLGEEEAAPPVVRPAGVPPIPSLAAARARRVRAIALAAAAAVFVLGTGLALRAWFAGATSSSFDVAIAAAAERLRAAEPTLLADLAPIGAAERAGGAVDTPRSGVRILEPAETVLSPKPPVSWEPVPGATGYVVTFSDAKTGAAIAHTKTGAPRLGPWVGKDLLVPGGTYLVEVEAQGDLGTQKASRVFRVATPELVRDYAAAAEMLERKASPPDVAYLTASLAVRKGLLLEAEKVLSRAAGQGPTNIGPTHPAFAATLELRAHVRRRLSWPALPTGR